MCVGELLVAVCSCSAGFADCDKEKMKKHITTDSGESHGWVWIKPGYLTPPRVYLKHLRQQLVHTTTLKGEECG